MSALLETKFHMPAGRPDSVARPRLLDRLRAGLGEGRRLTLICAPAGYGKSTLAAEWLKQTAAADSDARVAWLSLDASDNAPARFWGYWLAALQRVSGAPDLGALGRRAQSLLSLPKLPAWSAMLDELINDLAALKGRIVLALDDYHTIAHPEIHEAVAYCLDHQPPQLHLVILTRADPPLPLARLRARGQLTELRARDLRFTLDEASQFFARCMRLNLSPESVSALEARAEGWAAGLRLAGLALQHLPDPAAFIQHFRGSNRFVLDYLAEEVVRQQGDAVRDFLTRTAVLDRFNADLCDALTGRCDSRDMLRRLEQANLFLIPLDDERDWCRYHHLFADYLRAELARDERIDLLRRAARWHEDNGLDFEAVHYALLAAGIDGRFEEAADVIERAIQKTSSWSGGALSTLTGWLDALPAQIAQHRPLLCVHASRALFLAGRIEHAEQLLDRAEQALRSDAAPADPVAQLPALIALYRSGIAALRGELPRAIEGAAQALQRLSPSATHARARALDALGMAHELSGDMEQAARLFIQASDLATETGVLYLAINARCEAALAQLNLGRLRLAERSCRQALDLAAGEFDRPAQRNHQTTRPAEPPAGWAWAVLAEIALERHDLPVAQRNLEAAMDLSRRGGLTDDLRWELACLARLRQALGDAAGALDAMTQADTITQAYGIARLSALSAAQMARLHLAQGETGLATIWADTYQASRSAQRVDYLREYEDLTLACARLAQGLGDAAAQCLLPLLASARPAGRMRSVIEAMALLAVVEQARDDTPAALRYLREALLLAAPEGLRRPFVDAASLPGGAALAQLLTAARTAVGPSARAFADTVLQALQTLPHAQAQSGLPAPLSAQELNVLALVAAGKSNAEIAAALFISPGTAKWHVHNILQKLEAGNRAQAIARARELGLV